MNEKMISFLPIETERLIIRETVMEDVDLLLKLDKQEITQKFLGGIKNKTKDERLEFIKKKVNNFENGIVSSLTVCLKDENIAIGFLGFKIDEEKMDAEISYLFDYDYTKVGYCSECVEKLLKVGFKNLELCKIYADTIEENISSRKVLEKFGFRLVSTRKNQDNYTFIDYEILKEEYI